MDDDNDDEYEDVTSDSSEDPGSGLATVPGISGHVSVCYDGVLMVWGGYTSTDEIDYYISSRLVYRYDIDATSWGEVITSMTDSETDIPLPTAGACALLVDHYMYVFGGHLQTNTYSNNMYQLNLKTFKWKLLQTLGTPPNPRDKFCGSVYNNSKLVYFGGYGPKPVPELAKKGKFTWNHEVDHPHYHIYGWNNFIVIYNIDTNTWEYPETKGSRPCPRAAPCAVTLGNRLFVFGGRYLDVRRNDLHCLNFISMNWTMLRDVDSNADPIGRSWAVMVSVSDDCFVIQGGLSTDGSPLNDAWLYNSTTDRWKRIQWPETTPRFWHTGCSVGPNLGEIVVFGGSQRNVFRYQNSHHSSKVIVHRTVPRSLERLTLICISSLIKKGLLKSENIEDLPYDCIDKIRVRVSSFQRFW